MKGLHKFKSYASFIDETGVWTFREKKLAHACPEGPPQATTFSGHAYGADVHRDTETDKVVCSACKVNPPKKFHMWCWVQGLKVTIAPKPLTQEELGASSLRFTQGQQLNVKSLNQHYSNMFKMTGITNSRDVKTATEMKAIAEETQKQLQEKMRQQQAELEKAFLDIGMKWKRDMRQSEKKVK